MSLPIFSTTRSMLAIGGKRGSPDFLCGVYRDGEKLLQCYHIEGRELGSTWVLVALFREISEADAFIYTDHANLKPETFAELVERIGMKEILPSDPFLASAFGPVLFATSR